MHLKIGPLEKGRGVMLEKIIKEIAHKGETVHDFTSTTTQCLKGST